MQHTFDRNDPDATIIAQFKNLAIPNPSKSAAAGRLICDDVEVCEIRAAGRRDYQSYPSTSRSHWISDPLTGEQTAVTYAERFPRQYRQWKMHESQTKSGTPLEHAPFLTEARRAEMRALNIYTVDALAAIDGQELKNLGTNGRDLKNKAQEFMAEAAKGAPNAELVLQLEALRAKNQVLEEDVKQLQTLTQDRDDENGTDSRFDNMSVDQLRDFIAARSGHAPQGQLGRKTLLRMAMDAA